MRLYARLTEVTLTFAGKLVFDICTNLHYLTFRTKLEAAMIEVTVSEAREQSGRICWGKVQHGHEDVTIKKHGKPVAVMISVEAMEYYERLEDAELARELAAIYADPDYDPNETISAEESLPSFAWTTPLNEDATRSTIDRRRSKQLRAIRDRTAAERHWSGRSPPLPMTQARRDA